MTGRAKRIDLPALRGRRPARAKPHSRP